MADVSVEFGAKDTGLEQTLKTIQDQLVALDGELKSGTLSFDEINKKMREAAQAEKLHASLGGTKEKLDELGLSFRQTKPSVEEFKDTQKSVSAETEKTATSFKTMAGEMFELRAALENGNLSADEFDKTLRRLNKLEDIKQKMEDFKNSTANAGAAMAQAAPKADELGQRTESAGNKADSAAGIFDASFAKISAAFTVGNIAAQAFEKIIQTAFDIARAAAQGFSDALDLGGRLDDLSKRTGETAGKLLVLENAFIEAGVSADQVGTVINKLQNFMVDAANGGDKQTAAMNKLGISLTELEGKTPTEQIGVFAKAISGIEDPTQRAAVASDVFGEKLGGKLLPLLTEFTPALDNSRRSVGSLEQIMDENAATFAAAGDTIDRVKGKMAAFAAGIMSETLPALQDLGRDMEAVDAAGLGKEIGEALNPALQAFVDILRGAVDLTKSLGEAERNLQQSTGVLGQTYDAVYNSLAGFNQGMHDVMTTYTPFGMAMQALKERGEELRVSQDSATEGIKATGEAAVEAKPKLDALPGAGEALVSEFEKVPEAISSSLPMIGEFKANLDGAAPSITGIADGSLAVKNDFSEISSLTAQLPGQTETYNQTIGGVNEQLRLQDELYKKIIPEIQAAGLATDNTSKSAGKVTENLIGASVEAQTVKGLMDEIANAKMEASPERLKERTKDARKELKDMRDFIGQDLSQMPLDDIIDKLGLDPDGKLKTANEKLRAVETAIKDIGGADPAEITPQVDEVGVNDKLEKVKGYLAGIEKDKADATPKIDQESIKNQVATSSETIKKDLEKIKAEVKVKPKLDKEALKEEVDMAFASSKGTQHLSNIDKLVETIKGFVEKIEGKLPLQALAY